MLGLDVVDAARARDHDVVAFTHDELDITSADVDRVISRLRPDVVVNCAAWTDVDAAESRERDAMLVNDTGAGLLAAAAAQVGAMVVHPSTDYVFDGKRRTPYLESDLPAPLSAYGRSKLAGETAVAVANPKHAIVRSSWLFGLGGGNFVETMLRVGAEQPEVLVVSDQVGCPTYTLHLAGALVLLAEGEEYGIHHITGEGVCSWFEFAQEIFDQAGYDTRVMAATTDMLERPAPRPAYSVLGTERDNPIVLPPWRQALAEYLRLRARAAAAAAGGAT
jgi:dTDP-4-dehydrorhamnose reductase